MSSKHFPTLPNFSGLKDLFLTQVICYTFFLGQLGPLLHIVLTLESWLMGHSSSGMLSDCSDRRKRTLESLPLEIKCSIQKRHVANSHNSLIRTNEWPRCASLLVCTLSPFSSLLDLALVCKRLHFPGFLAFWLPGSCSHWGIVMGEWKAGGVEKLHFFILSLSQFWRALPAAMASV